VEGGGEPLEAIARASGNACAICLICLCQWRNVLELVTGLTSVAEYLVTSWRTYLRRHAGPPVFPERCLAIAFDGGAAPGTELAMLWQVAGEQTVQANAVVN
jgi:hypothetical protein